MYSTIRKLYVVLFTLNPLMRKLNKKILDLALGALGYNNYRNNIESGELYFIKEVLNKFNPKFCMDIGANKGDYTLLLLSNTNSKVVCFEPLPLVYDQLIMNVLDYKDRCTCINSAVGAEAGKERIFFNSNATAHASMLREINNVDYVNNQSEVLVDVITVDEFCANNAITNIDLIKIDTEGFEREVILGAKNVIAKNKPKFIQLEFNWHQLFRATTVNYFAQELKNYHVYQLGYNRLTRIDPSSPLANVIFSQILYLSGRI